MSKTDNIREVLRYIDLTLNVDIEPDDNENCWIRIEGWCSPHGPGTMNFDITEDEADLLIAALLEYKRRLAKEREGE